MYKTICTRSIVRAACMALILAAGTGLHAQAYCGFDETRKLLVESDPAYLQREKQVNELLYREAIQPGQRMMAVRYIPVVVHIIHNNGPENIPDSTVIAGINELNLRFQNAGTFYDPAGTNTDIQFCLASVDPYGNPTNGITRTVSWLTDLSAAGASDLAMKNLNRWDPSLYLNIWVVRSAGSPAGYATYPSSAGTGIDGIVIRSDQYAGSYTLTHETGHYLGLYHTFNSFIQFNMSCVNGNCLLDGDRVCDTPPDITNNQLCPTNSCSTEMDDTSGFNPFTSDVMDSPNYMDYTTCALLFTPGQSARMNASLTTSRYLLLQSNGCGGNPGGPVPVAAFTATPACGGTLLVNTSLNSTGAQWDFNSDGQLDNAGNVVLFNAPATGYYTVTMYAAGIGGTDTITMTILAQHYPYQNYPMINGFSGISISQGGRVTICEGAVVTFYGEPGMAHYYWSNGDTTQNTSFIADSTAISISLTAIDSAGLTWISCYPIQAVPVPAPIPPVISLPPDTAFCIGEPLQLNFTYSPIGYTGTLFLLSGNIQNFHNPTYSTTVALDNLFWYTEKDTNGCTATSNTIHYYGLYSPGSGNITQLGNTLYYGAGTFQQWYLNNMPIPNSNTNSYTPLVPGCYKVFAWYLNAEECGSFSSDSVCLVTVGTGENTGIEQLQLSPNPFTTELMITFPAEVQHATIRITDATGREIRKFCFSGQTAIIERGEMSSGVYFLEVRDEENHAITRKIIVQ